MNNTIRWLLGGLCAGVIMILFSFPVHGLLFERYWEAVPFTRPTSAWQFIPGAPIVTIGFGILLSWGFARLYEGIPGRGLFKGLNYGLIVFLIFIPFAETWNYLQLEIPFMVVIAGLIHYLITLPLGGVAIAALYGKRLDKVNGRFIA